MSQPILTYSYTASKISDESDYNKITVTLSCNKATQQILCYATKLGDPFGVGQGYQCAALAGSPANTERLFDIFYTYLTKGDGIYRIGLYAQDTDGTWNYEYFFLTSDYLLVVTSDNNIFKCASNGLPIPFAMEVKYTGSTVAPSWLNYDTTKMAISGTTSAAERGTYYAIFTLLGDNHWEDGSVSSKTVSWKII